MSVKLTNITKETQVTLAGLTRDGSLVSLAPTESTTLAISSLNDNYLDTVALFSTSIDLSKVTEQLVQAPAIDKKKEAADAKLASDKAAADAKVAADKAASELAKASTGTKA